MRCLVNKYTVNNKRKAEGYQRTLWNRWQGDREDLERGWLLRSVLSRSLSDSCGGWGLGCAKQKKDGVRYWEWQRPEVRPGKQGSDQEGLVWLLRILDSLKTKGNLWKTLNKGTIGLSLSFRNRTVSKERMDFLRLGKEDDKYILDTRIVSNPWERKGAWIGGGIMQSGSIFPKTDHLPAMKDRPGWCPCIWFEELSRWWSCNLGRSPLEADLWGAVQESDCVPCKAKESPGRQGCKKLPRPCTQANCFFLNLGGRCWRMWGAMP